MSVPRRAAERQPLVTTDDMSVLASHKPAEDYSSLQL